MIIVPEKTIAYYPVIPDEGVTEFDMNISTFLKPLNENHEREWFSSHFYKCLPLSIGNMQGFVFSVPFDFNIFWNGKNNPEDLKIQKIGESEIDPNMCHVYLTSEFGHGILTIHFPIVLKTPPGINLMTIAPPNYPVPGLSPMTGVVETDNLRFTFTLNIKIDLANTNINVKKDYPVVGIIPIPRYFCDSFELVNAYEIIDKDDIEEERTIVKEHSVVRNMNNAEKIEQDRLYYKGMDVRKNKFKDHQLPRKRK